MAGDIAYKLTADEAQALQAVSRLSREFGLNETAIKKAVEATKDLDRTQQQMGREAARVFEQTRTPLEAQLGQLQKLDELYKANKIDAETYGRAAEQTAQKQAEDYKKVADAQKPAFGEQAKASLQQYANAATLVENAIGAINERLKAAIELQKQAASSDRSAEMSEGSLAEVADGDPEKYQQLLATSRGIAAKSGMKREQAAALTFAAESAGNLDEVGTFADLYQQGVVQDPEALMRATKTIQTATGEENSGSLRDITSQLLAAGHYSPQKIAQLGPAAANAGVNARDAGVTEQELLAAVAVESKATGSADLAATMQKSLQKTLAALKSNKAGKPGEIATDEDGHILDQKAQILRDDARIVLAKSEDKSLTGQLHAIQGMKLDPQQMQKLFGRQEGLMAYNLLLRNEEQVHKATRDILLAPRENLVGKTLALTGADEQGAAAKAARVQEEGAKVKLAGSKIGVARNVEDAAYAALEAKYSTGELKPRMFHTPESEITTLQGWKQDTMLRKGHLRSEVLGEGSNGQWKLDNNPELLAQLVQAEGGEEKVFGDRQNWHGGKDTSGLEHFKEVTKDLRDATGNLKAAFQAKPTLGGPGPDPGQPVSR